VSIRDAGLPEFSPAIRGFNRRQVLDYLQRLREYAAELEERVGIVETELAAERERTVRTQAAATQPSDTNDTHPAGTLRREEVDELRQLRESTREELRRLCASLRPFIDRPTPRPRPHP